MRKLTRSIAVLALSLACALAAAAPVAAAPGDPLLVFAPSGATPPPGGGFNNPCGMAVDQAGNFYVSDYYHHTVDVFSSSTGYITQRAGIDPANGPCGLAVNSAGRVYVNDYHRDVVPYTPSFFPPITATSYSPGAVLDPADPTGVAVNAQTNQVYVNDRTHVAGYSSTGAPLLDGGGQPLKIGLGTLVDAYGVAVSEFGGTFGRVYVPDAATSTVKVYGLNSTGPPLTTIDGPPGGFVSLVESAVAVDRVTGDVYVADRQSSVYSERPESTIQVFSESGTYRGHLKYNVIDGAPVGLAVDNSSGPTQGRVYVTSGNTTGGSVYIYAPGSAVFSPPLPAPASIAAAAAEGKAASGLGAERAGETVPPPASPASATASEAIQQGNVRLDVNGQISPQRLPRKGAAPIAVEVGWRIATTDGAPPPKLRTLKIEINRAGRFDFEGLPTCPYAKIQPATTQRALSNCRPALVGRGSFRALIALAGQESYVAAGQMLVFNGLQGGKPVLLGQIYSAKPFANSFVIPFKLSEVRKGTYGTALAATLPAALRAWGSLTEIQMRLQRKFGYQGVQHSFISAGCPAPKGFGRVVFPLARTSFGFEGGMRQELTLNRSCRARG